MSSSICNRSWPGTSPRFHGLACIAGTHLSCMTSLGSPSMPRPWQRWWPGSSSSGRTQRPRCFLAGTTTLPRAAASDAMVLGPRGPNASIGLLLLTFSCEYIATTEPRDVHSLTEANSYSPRDRRGRWCAHVVCLFLTKCVRGLGPSLQGTRRRVKC